jgi:regulator of sigma E protease
MLDVLWSFGGFLVAIGVLVAFHEFGHYWVARRCGVRVLRFSIGFGRPLWTRTAADGTEWSVAMIPLGGYVRMLDEREGEVPASQRHLAFNTQPLSRRAAIVAAGPAFNFILAILFYWLVFVFGVQGIKPVIAAPPEASAAAAAGLRQGEQVLRVDGRETPTWQVLRTRLIDRALARGTLDIEVQDPQGAVRRVTLDLSAIRVDPEWLFADLGLNPYEPPVPPVLEEVIPGEPAAAAGFEPGDRLLSYDGVPIESWQQWAGWLRARPGELVTLQIQRGGQRLERQLIIGEADGIGRFGARVAVPADLWQDLRAESRLNPVAALPAAMAQTWQMSWLTLKMLWRMVQGEVSVKHVSGPIQIAQVAGYSAQIGLVSFLSFMAIVSISLGVLNLLPVPVLDGGHLLFYGIEAVKGSPLSERAQEAGSRLGLMLLAGLMGLAFYNDIMRLIQ